MKLAQKWLFVLTFTVYSICSSANMTHKSTLERFADIAKNYETSLLNYSPETGMFIGKTNVVQDRFTDYSQQAYQHWLLQEDHFLAEINALNENELKASDQYITYLLLKDFLAAKKASRICQEQLWDVNPLSGWHNNLAVVAGQQPVGTPEYRALALLRWQSFGKVVDDQIANLREGVRLGYTAPTPAVERVLEQIEIIVNSPIEKSPYFDFAQRDSDAHFKQEVTQLMQTVINPSLKKYAAYLKTEYLPSARKEIGLSALPSGDACYLAKINENTTLSISPAAIHALGLSKMQDLEKQVGDIGAKKYGTRNMVDVFSRARSESTHVFATEKAMLDYNFAALNKAKSKVGAWFDIIPKAEGTLKPYPTHKAKTGAAGEYHPPSDDGLTPGIFYINTYEPSQRSRIDQEATLYHELIPGHHFQIALQYENKAIPELNRYLMNSGFVEGWALYAEQLADEMDIYADDISRLGMYSNDALRAARLVVDSGIHAFHWSRQQAVDYLKQHSALDNNIIEGEVDRYIMNPGQASSYMLGKVEILRLRTLAQSKLNTRFDIREFHNQVLKNGAVTLPMLKGQIEDWLRK